ncbi:MAG: LamG-like jellyroll fold domain-containing protein, partial [Patescibacteria group bacterium]
SADEIRQIYNGGAVKINSSQNSRLTNGLVGMWSFNGADLTTTTSTDVSGSGNNGTLAGPTGAQNKPQPVIGKIGQALNFDGTDDYVSIPDANSLDITNNFSISLWVKPANLTQTNKYILSKPKTATINDNTYSLLWEYTNNQVEFYSNDYTGT